MATSLLDQSLGPIITTWQNLPIYGKVAVAGGAAVAFIGYQYLQNRSKEDTLEATDWKEKWEHLIKIPTEKSGRPENTLLLNQSDTAGKRTMGTIKKLNNTTTRIGGDELKDALDKDLYKKLEQSGELDVEVVSYAVVPGRKKLDRLFNTITYKLAGIFAKGSNPQAEYFDLPTDAVRVTDQGVVIKKDVHIFKKDGLWQTAGTKGQHRLMQLSALSTHQNWLESLQKHPEFYSDLNMNVSGEKNIMNTKSQNMREYKKEEKLQDKGEAMEE